MASGMNQSMRPLRAPNSAVNLSANIASWAPPRFIKRGLVSCFTSSSSIGGTGAQAAVMPGAKLRRINARKRSAAGATAAWAIVAARPEPPKKPSNSTSNSPGSTLTNISPGSGFKRMVTKQPGTGNAACNSPAFAESNAVNCTVASRPTKLDSAAACALRQRLADDLQHRQLRAIDALRGEVEGTHVPRRRLFQQRRDLFLGNGIRARGIGTGHRQQAAASAITAPRSW